MRCPAFPTVVVCAVSLAAISGEMLSGQQPSSALIKQAATACEHLASTEVVFVGQAEKAVVYRLAFEREIEKARQNWLAAQARLDRSPKDIELARQAAEALNEFEVLRNHYPNPHAYVLTPLRVEVGLRGFLTARAFVEVRSGAPLEPGSSYLIYGERNFWMFGSDIITSTVDPRPLSTADYELRIIRGAATGSGGGVVFGVIELEHALDWSKPLTSLGGVNIRISGPGYFADTVTDSDGTFLVAGVPAGPVAIAPSLSEKLTIANRSSLTVHVSDGGFVPVRLRAALNGRVRGRVIGRDGKPRIARRVQLVPVNPARHYGGIPARFTASTSDQGDFEFFTLPPGAYLLGVNLPESDVVFPTAKSEPPMFYPGTPNRLAALPIIVGEGTEHSGFNFTIP